jgi:hypothetical protein
MGETLNSHQSFNTKPYVGRVMYEGNGKRLSALGYRRSAPSMNRCQLCWRRCARALTTHPQLASLFRLEITRSFPVQIVLTRSNDEWLKADCRVPTASSDTIKSFAFPARTSS